MSTTTSWSLRNRHFPQLETCVPTFPVKYPAIWKTTAHYTPASVQIHMAKCLLKHSSIMSSLRFVKLVLWHIHKPRIYKIMLGNLWKSQVFYFFFAHELPTNHQWFPCWELDHMSRNEDCQKSCLLLLLCFFLWAGAVCLEKHLACGWAAALCSSWVSVLFWWIALFWVKFKSILGECIALFWVKSIWGHCFGIC